MGVKTWYKYGFFPFSSELRSINMVETVFLSPLFLKSVTEAVIPCDSMLDLHLYVLLMHLLKYVVGVVT